MKKKNLYFYFDFFTQNDFTNLIAKYFKKNEVLVIFDVGCYIGNFSERLQSQINRKSKFYLFDPNPNLKPITSHLFENYNIALGSKNTKKEFYLNTLLEHSGSSMSNITKNDFFWNLSRKLLFFKFKKIFKKILINSETINNFCEKKKIKKIDVLKIDVEGSELEVILGARKMLKKTKIIQIEVFDKKDIIMSKINTIQNLLKKYSFTIVKIKKIYSVSIFSNIAAYDILLVNDAYKN